MITSVEYQDIYQNVLVAVIDGITMHVPPDERNIHYQMVQEWVAQGNIIQMSSGNEHLENFFE